MRIPRVLLAAGASGSGKTLITCGILQALLRRGKKVASFKCGPDYIDPMFHSRVLQTPSANLDPFFASEEVVRELLKENAAACDMAVMEGVMGYYDGVAGTTLKASAYDLARITDTPVILIVNSKGMSLSLAAYIKGFLTYQEDSRIRGVIFNQMSPMIYPRMKKKIEEELGVKVLGYVPRVDECVIESRHLGLVLPDEIRDLRERLKKLAQVLEGTLDLDGIMKLAEEAPELNNGSELWKLHPSFGFCLSEPVRIGVAKDEAFCFFYKDNFRLLEKMGAELVPFSPIHDSHLPEKLDGILLYGGYPELYAGELGKNISMKEEIRSVCDRGMPCMAECGGFLYLHEELEDMSGNSYPMAGVIRGKAWRTLKLNRFGYITLTVNDKEADFFGKIPAHEFHYFESDNCGSDFHAAKPESSRGWDCIHLEEKMLAGFPHFYYYGNPAVPEWFLKNCLEYKKERH